MIIAGDIGGTKTNIALFDNQSYECLELMSFQSHKYMDLQTIVLEFMRHVSSKYDLSKLEAAAFAIAGPVKGGICKTTNLPWVIDAAVLSQVLKIPFVFLLNDLEANAYALDILPKSCLISLQDGKKQVGNRAVISPGTGLGEAGLFWDGEHYHPFASEGGHCDFGPLTELQTELSTYLQKRFGHASYERILSGPGLFNIYAFLSEVKGRKEIPEVIEELKTKDPAFVISEFALSKKSELCVEALHLFVSIFGQEAGNVALKFMALGGIYLGGGIPPKILPLLKQPLFLEGFLGKGRFRSLLEEVPIFVIADDKASLKGAARFIATISQSAV